MYTALKHFGVSNHDAALALLDARLTFDGRALQERIDESSQLSRRIVHTVPGELPIGLFVNFHLSCPQLYRKIIEIMTLTKCDGRQDLAIARLTEELSTGYFERMASALESNGVDSLPYRNMVSYVDLADVDDSNRALLHFMMFVITGCLGNPRVASLYTVDYATDILGVDYHTAQAAIGTASKPVEVEADVGLGLVRIVDGRIKAGASTHVLDPEGTELGLLPRAKHTIIDVGTDVSRKHARVWREDGRWLIRDLGSTNGTRVVSGTTGDEIPVGSGPDVQVELHPTDIVCLGETTRFIVVSVLGG